MTWQDVADVVGAGLLLLGSALSLLAAIGMLRLPDLLSRMHALTKPQVLGLFLVVIGLALRLGELRPLGLLALVVLFQLMTAPVASHIISRAALRAGVVRRELLLVDEAVHPIRSEEPDPGAEGTRERRVREADERGRG